MLRVWREKRRHKMFQNFILLTPGDRERTNGATLANGHLLAPTAKYNVEIEASPSSSRQG
jgi:hypothetical protein